MSGDKNDNKNNAAVAAEAAAAAAAAATAKTIPSTANANAGCVGPASDRAGKASACEGCPSKGACSSGAYNSPEALARAKAEADALKSSLHNVSHVVLVLSGKGGVGKSTVASQLSHTLASRGYAVGLLDVDLCGPSAPRMVLGDSFASQSIHKNGSGAWVPVYAHDNLAVMSISFLLQDTDQAVVWRGPRKNALIQQFLTEVDWTGDTEGLDYLIVDTPPGTSDEHISVVQYLQKAEAVAGAVVVTTPEEVSLADVRKELSFCKKTGVPVLGVIENMSVYQTSLDKMKFVTKRDGADCTAAVLEKLADKCPEVLKDCYVRQNLFAASTGGAAAMASDCGVPYWGQLPLDPDLVMACERGRPFVAGGSGSKNTEHDDEPPASKALKDFCNRITKELPVDMDG